MKDASLLINHRQRSRRVNRLKFRSAVEAILSEWKVDFEIGIHLVGASEMARVNWQFLRHEGSTDVITFDHGTTPEKIHGELFISVPDAIEQSQEFGTDWTEELLRYVIHGLLHLRGHDDLSPGPRRKMKRIENRLTTRFRSLATDFGAA